MFAGRGSFLWADRVSRAERGRGGGMFWRFRASEVDLSRGTIGV